MGRLSGVVASPPPPLDVCGLGKRFGDQVVLAGLELRLAAGDLVVLLGPNGAGKSTLLACLSGLLVPDAGSVHVAGHDLFAAPRRARAALRLLPQEPVLPAGVTGRELLEFWAGVYDDLAGVEAAAALAGLSPGDLRRLVSVYSLGQRRRIQAAPLALGSPRLLLLDEPLAGLDAEARARLLAALSERLHEGAAALVASHGDADDPVRALATRTLRLDGGAVVPA